jgi:alpha-D-ribose 1-methylphosphonate 5-triphosphate synthase subunit PhnG
MPAVLLGEPTVLRATQRLRGQPDRPYCGDQSSIQRQHPHLTLSQIYAALTYYHDHQEAFDADIREQLSDVDMLAAQQGSSTIRAKLQGTRRL